MGNNLKIKCNLNQFIDSTLSRNFVRENKKNPCLNSYDQISNMQQLGYITEDGRTVGNLNFDYIHR